MTEFPVRWYDEATVFLNVVGEKRVNFLLACMSMYPSTVRELNSKAAFRLIHKSSVLVINGINTYHLHTRLQTGYKQLLLTFVLLRASSCWFVDSSGRIDFDVSCCSRVVFYGIRLERRQYNQNHRRNLANNKGGEQNRPWVLGDLIYEGRKLEWGGEDWFEPVLRIHTSLSSLSLQMFYYYYYYYLLQLSFHSVAVVLTLVTNKNKCT